MTKKMEYYGLDVIRKHVVNGFTKTAWRNRPKNTDGKVEMYEVWYCHSCKTWLYKE
jgi:hypothetical protein